MQGRLCETQDAAHARRTGVCTPTGSLNLSKGHTPTPSPTT